MSIYSFKTFQFKCLSDFIDEKQNNTEYWTEIWIWEKPLFDPDQQLQKQNPFIQGKFYSILEAFNFTILTCNKNGSVPTSIALHPLVN